MDYTIFDGIALGDVISEDGAPKPFRLFRIGENALTQNGKDFKLTLSAEDMDNIVEYQRKKGEKIPIDSRHALMLAAEKAHVTESEALQAVPSAVAALGFASLERRDDGLYASDVALNGDGKAVPAADTAGLKVVGIAKDVSDGYVEVFHALYLWPTEAPAQRLRGRIAARPRCVSASRSGHSMWRKRQTISERISLLLPDLKCCRIRKRDQKKSPVGSRFADHAGRHNRPHDSDPDPP